MKKISMAEGLAYGSKEWPAKGMNKNSFLLYSHPSLYSFLFFYSWRRTILFYYWSLLFFPAIALIPPYHPYIWHELHMNFSFYFLGRRLVLCNIGWDVKQTPLSVLSCLICTASHVLSEYIGLSVDIVGQLIICQILVMLDNETCTWRLFTVISHRNSAWHAGSIRLAQIYISKKRLPDVKLTLHILLMLMPWLINSSRKGIIFRVSGG